MSWTLILVILVFVLIYTLDRRIRRLEEARGRGYSQSFSINALDAVLVNRMFGELSKIRSAEEEKSYKDWTDSERKKWDKDFRSEIVNKVYVGIKYLSSEDAFFVKTKDQSGFVLPKIEKRYLYSSCLIGEDDSFEDHLEFGLVERIIDYKEGKTRAITGYLRENNGKDNDKSKTIILFDFPYDRMDMTDDDLKNLGFEVKRREGSWPYEDMFGEMTVPPTMIDYTKNGCKITYVV